MKKNLFCLITSITFIATSYSCNKDKQMINKGQSPVEILKASYKRSTNNAGELYMINDLVQTKFGAFSSQYHFQGAFIASNFVQNVAFNSYQIAVSNNSFFSSSAVDSAALANNQDDYFGANNLVLINGDTLLKEFYAPKPVQISFVGIAPNQDFTFSKSNGINLVFSDDLNNSNPIVVVLQYIPENAQSGQAVLTKTFTYPPNSSSVSIDPSDLFQFPTNTDLIMYVGSGNEVFNSINGNQYSVTAINITAIPKVRLN